MRAYANTQPAPDLDALVRKHADLVKRIAYHLAGRLPPQVEIADLMQAGMMGLLEAAQNYASGRGASFETYAGIRIRGAMLDALRKLDWAPRSVHRKARAAALALREVEARLGAEASETDVAAQMGVSLTEYQQHPAGCARLPAAAATTRRTTARTPRSIACPTVRPIRKASRSRSRAARRSSTAMRALPERERLVLSLYYEQELNLKEIGAVLKVTESRVCQLHGQALLRLKALLAEWYQLGARDGRTQHHRPGAGGRGDRAGRDPQGRRRACAGVLGGVHDRDRRHGGGDLRADAAGGDAAGVRDAAMGVPAAAVRTGAADEEDRRAGATSRAARVCWDWRA